MSRLISIVTAVAAALIAVPAAAAATAPAVNTSATGIAMNGYDPVAYFLEGKPVKGQAQHRLEWNGAQWHFSSTSSREAFAANPERFAPQFGGYCAWAVSQHYLAPGDPNFWKIVDGKLYLNANARAKELWEAEQADAIERGHSNWPAVLSVNQDSGDDR
jgi:YHS domain-containing protein